MSKELDRKTKIIQEHLYNLSLGRSSVDMDRYRQERIREGGIMSSLYGGSGEIINPNLMRDLISRLQSIVEETLLQNVQLKNDLNVLGDECKRLADELAQLKKNRL